MVMRYGMGQTYSILPWKESGKRLDNIQNSGKESLQSLNIKLPQNAVIEMVKVVLDLWKCVKVVGLGKLVYKQKNSCEMSHLRCETFLIVVLFSARYLVEIVALINALYWDKSLKLIFTFKVSLLKTE